MTFENFSKLPKRIAANSRDEPPIDIVFLYFFPATAFSVDDDFRDWTSSGSAVWSISDKELITIINYIYVFIQEINTMILTQVSSIFNSTSAVELKLGKIFIFATF